MLLQIRSAEEEHRSFATSGYNQDQTIQGSSHIDGSQSPIGMELEEE